MGETKATFPRKKPLPSFARAIEAAEHLTLVKGLGAVKKAEGKDRIGADAAKLLGSVNIDDDCRKAYPRDSRWDYVIGVRRLSAPVAFFVEVHSAETSEVSTMEKKLKWLLTFILRDKQRALLSLPREIHWVASGRVNIPKHVPQYKRLQTQLRRDGLQGPTTMLALA